MESNWDQRPQEGSLLAAVASLWGSEEAGTGVGLSSIDRLPLNNNAPSRYDRQAVQSSAYENEGMNSVHRPPPNKNIPSQYERQAAQTVASVSQYAAGAFPVEPMFGPATSQRPAACGPSVRHQVRFEESQAPQGATCGVQIPMQTAPSPFAQIELPQQGTELDMPGVFGHSNRPIQSVQQSVEHLQHLALNNQEAATEQQAAQPQPVEHMQHLAFNIQEAATEQRAAQPPWVLKAPNAAMDMKKLAHYLQPSTLQHAEIDGAWDMKAVAKFPPGAAVEHVHQNVHDPWRPQMYPAAHVEIDGAWDMKAAAQFPPGAAVEHLHQNVHHPSMPQMYPAAHRSFTGAESSGCAREQCWPGPVQSNNGHVPQSHDFPQALAAPIHQQPNQGSSVNRVPPTVASGLAARLGQTIQMIEGKGNANQVVGDLREIQAIYSASRRAPIP